jgi:uncharacterized SAM-binding protein YcdF (DUF218 family)
VSAIVAFVFSAGGLTVSTAICALWVSATPGSRAARRALQGVGAGYLVASLYAVPYAVGQLLLVGLHPFTMADVPAGRMAIVVLGSGSQTVRDWDGARYATVDVTAAARVLEAVRVFRMIDAAVVVSSGGLIDPTGPATPTGESMQNALVALGIPRDRVMVETESRNTHEEAVVVKRMLNGLAVDRVVLVTSDTHMRRSLGAFKAEGLPCVPAMARNPVLDERSRRVWWAPSARGLWYSGEIVHELLGIVYYAARGWFRL